LVAAEQPTVYNDWSSNVARFYVCYWYPLVFEELYGSIAGSFYLAEYLNYS